MTYPVAVTPRAARQLQRLDATGRRRVQGVVELLAKEPRPALAKKLGAGDPGWRVTSAGLRVIYEIVNKTLVVVAVSQPPGAHDME